MTTIHIIAAFMGGGLVGFFACAVMTVGRVGEDFDDYPDCQNCGDCGWVCENHPDIAWSGLTKEPECCGGAGAPCRCCEWELATSGIREEAVEAHARCADALTTVQGKITDIRDLVDERRTIRKADIRAVLGDA